ncbi:hypothetical protein VHEMI00057 [[Torrubiella] hemipterigena]|uniref:Uncharacterized protein n=1 Tax=[Torrubiella] hemipterigena TaxID=1531966 RepID=A0A0A1T0R6_9HYPO|nr:hypothetical protein VHEMI00057 [[Torrubiella] hemipterigena]
MTALQSPDTKATCSASKRRSSQTLDHSVKQQKLAHPSSPPPIFWDRLSEIPLTRNALRESDRRRALQTPCDPATDQDPAQRVARNGTSCVLPLDIPQQIKHFAKRGGPDLSKLRGYPIPLRSQETMNFNQLIFDSHQRESKSQIAKASQEPEETPATGTSKTGPYDRAFLQHLVDHHIFPEGYKYPDGRSPATPSNMDAIREFLGRPRTPQSKPEFLTTDFAEFSEISIRATKGSDILTWAIPMIERRIADRNCRAGGIPFTNFDHLTDRTLVPGHPDLLHGARPEQLDKEIRGRLDGQIVPSTRCDLPIIPNFFLQVKGSGGSVEVVLLQALYHGALGARAMHSLQSYGQPTPIYDNNAYALTSIYHYGILRMFTVHPLPPAASGHPPGFVMTHVNSWCMFGNYEAFLQGATAYRNALDWAKQQRDNMINRANTIVP